MGVLELVAAFAWPRVAALALVVFQRPISQLVEALRPRSLQYKGLTLEFAERLDLVEAETKKLDVQPASKRTHQFTTDAVPVLSSEVKINRAWYSLRTVMWRLAESKGKKAGNQRQVLANIKWLEENGIIEEELADAIGSLKQLRDRAREMSDYFQITSELADRFVQASSTIAASLEAMSQRA